MPSITSLANAYDPEEYGNLFPRLVGTNGGLVCDKKPFGEFIDIQVISHSDRWMITPKAEQTDQDAKKMCRASYDGKTIPGRDDEEPMLIEDYKKEIIAKGYEVNRVTKYRDIFCVVFNCEKNLDIAEEKGIIQVSVSPTSVKQFKAFTMQTPLFISRGKMLKTHQNCMRIVADPHDGDISYTLMEFKVTPIDVVKQYTPVV